MEELKLSVKFLNGGYPSGLVAYAAESDEAGIRLRFLAPPGLLERAPHEIINALTAKDLATEIAVEDAMSKGDPILVNGEPMDPAAYSACAPCDCAPGVPVPGR